jgi:DNA-binding response OmpR family regulator
MRIGSKTPQVLVVSDDDSLQRSTCTALLADGLACRMLADPSSMIDIAVQDPPDLVLLDADVSGFDGRDLLRALKRHPRTTEIPVFLLTGQVRQWGRQAALDLGAEEYLEKPLPSAGIGRRIIDHLDKQASSRRATLPPSDTTITTSAAIDQRQADVLRAEEAAMRANLPTLRISRRTLRHPVLIVEDDEDVRESLMQILEDQGIATVTAKNGQEALDLLHDETVRPSLILLDLMMPVMDGWEFRERIDADVSTPPPVVVMSARPRDDSVRSAAWLQKPLHIDVLLSTIQRFAAA